jgi:heme-degrading monooxygenase HmoA
MIARIWHGWTQLSNADAYETLLRREIFVGIAARASLGFIGIDLLRRDQSTEVEFVTVMWFHSLDAVREFAGDDYEKAVVPEPARRLLERYDTHSHHYSLVERHAPSA